MVEKAAIITFFDPHHSLAVAICVDGSRCWLDRGLLCRLPAVAATQKVIVMFNDLDEPLSVREARTK